MNSRYEKAKSAGTSAPQALQKENENSRCAVSKKCSGCQLSNIDYSRQLRYKQAQAVKLLRGFCHVESIIGMAYPCHYRNKATAALRRTTSGKIISGVYQSATGGIVATDSCLLNDSAANKIIAAARGLIIQLRIPVYDPATGNGTVRHFMVRSSRAAGSARTEYMLAIVCATDSPPRIDEFAQRLTAEHSEIKTIVLCKSTSRKQTVGSVVRVLTGSGYIEDTLCGKRFRVSPRSFYQVNPTQTQVLYETAADLAQLTGSERVLDAYCGTGTIGLTVCGAAKEVVGVELNESSVRDAQENIALNGATNMSVVCGDAAELMAKTARAAKARLGTAAKSVSPTETNGFDVVFIDPPRAGCSMKFLKALVSVSPQRVVYVSCEPQTLARDLRFLTQHGYTVRRIQPVDMFPWTKHIETVVSLSQADK